LKELEGINTATDPKPFLISKRTDILLKIVDYTLMFIMIYLAIQVIIHPINKIEVTTTTTGARCVSEKNYRVDHYCLYLVEDSVQYPKPYAWDLIPMDVNLSQNNTG
jgi:hypothetical protein